jgi:hypothetical protein
MLTHYPSVTLSDFLRTAPICAAKVVGLLSAADLPNVLYLMEFHRS